MIGRVVEEGGRLADRSAAVDGVDSSVAGPDR